MNSPTQALLSSAERGDVMRAFPGWAIVLTLLISAAAVAQSVAVSSSTSTSSAPCNCTLRQHEPYSATFKTTTVQTLADGTTITRVRTETMARDSAGRTMSSDTQGPFGNGRREFTYGRAHDPVTNTDMNWNSQSQEARVIHLPPADERHGCWASDDGHMQFNYGPIRPPIASPAVAAERGLGTRAGGGVGTGGGAMSVTLPDNAPQPSRSQVEDLGTSTIMGVEVRGTRTTFTTPAGQIGNDRPLVHTNETWIAPSLGLTLRFIGDDPQSGKTTREVQSLEVGEPPISMFAPPEGYKVIDEQLRPVDCAARP
jgi:hypothetical protein